MSNSKLRENIRSFFEILLTALLFGTQTILNVGAAISIMLIPLLPYLFVLPSYLHDHPYALPSEISAMFFHNTYFVGRIVAFVGVIIFCLAATQWIWYHHKNVGLFNRGLYAKVRHPQFTGIIIITLGLTIIVLTFGSFDLSGPFLSGSTLSSLQIVGLWFLQILGYIIIARYEEWHLSKKFGDKYKEYKRKVPFLFPLKSPHRIPETFFTFLIVIFLCLILILLPYDLIRDYSGRYIPNLQFS